MKLTWVGLPSSATTWEDYNVVKERFPTTPAWGQAGPQVGGSVTPDGGATHSEGHRRREAQGGVVFRIDLAYLCIAFSFMNYRVGPCGRRL